MLRAVINIQVSRKSNNLLIHFSLKPQLKMELAIIGIIIMSVLLIHKLKKIKQIIQEMAQIKSNSSL